MREQIHYCDGKVAYDKRGAVTAKNKRFHDDRIILRVYQCGNHWHLTKRIDNNTYGRRGKFKSIRQSEKSIVTCKIYDKDQD